VTAIVAAGAILALAAIIARKTGKPGRGSARWRRDPWASRRDPWG